VELFIAVTLTFILLFRLFWFIIRGTDVKKSYIAFCQTKRQFNSQMVSPTLHFIASIMVLPSFPVQSLFIFQ